MEPTPPRFGVFRKLGQLARLIFWTLIFAAVVVVAVVAVFFAGRVLLYEQEDDEQHLASKRSYLEEIWNTTSDLAAPPNIVVILFDDLGHGDLGAYGGDAIDTPNLDRLAAEGLLFKNAYSPSPYCSASRAGLMTGRYAVRSGLDHVIQVPGSWQDNLVRLGGLNRRLPAEEITLAEVLRAAGYATAIVGKWHLGDQSPSLPNDMGFDSFYGLLFSNDQGKPVVWRRPRDRRAASDRSDDADPPLHRTCGGVHRGEPGSAVLSLPAAHLSAHPAPRRQGSPRETRLAASTAMSSRSSTGAPARSSIRSSGSGVAEQHPGSRQLVTTDRGSRAARAAFAAASSMSSRAACGCRSSSAGRNAISPGAVDEDPVVAIDLFPTILDLIGVPAAARPGDRWHEPCPEIRGRGERAAGPGLVPPGRSPARRPPEAGSSTTTATGCRSATHRTSASGSGPSAVLALRPRARPRRVLRRIKTPPGDLRTHGGAPGGAPPGAGEKPTRLAITPLRSSSLHTVGTAPGMTPSIQDVASGDRSTIE